MAVAWVLQTTMSHPRSLEVAAGAGQSQRRRGKSSVNAAHARQPAWSDDLDRLRSAGVQLINGEDVWPLVALAAVRVLRRPQRPARARHVMHSASSRHR